MPINVKDSPYRAAGNGWADDTGAIQAIINALNEQNRAKIDRLSLPRLLDFTWKNVA